MTRREQESPYRDWWIVRELPEDPPPVLVRAGVLKIGNRLWCLSRPKLFEAYNEQFLRMLFLYLQWCEREGRRPKYMPARCMEELFELLPRLRKRTVAPEGSSRSGRVEYWLQSSHRWPLDTQLDKRVMHHWVQEATAWELALAQGEVNGPGELRDAMYRINVALEAALSAGDAATLEYVGGWMRELQRLLG